MNEFLLSADVARELGITPASVRHVASIGRLSVAATTETGVRLFRRADVERFKRDRALTKTRFGFQPKPRCSLIC